MDNIPASALESYSVLGPRETHRAGLLTLPAELREQILLEVVKEAAPVTPVKTASARNRTFKLPTASRGCKQLRDECLALYYSVNIFRFDIEGIQREATLGKTEKLGSSYNTWCTIAGHNNIRRIRTFVFTDPSGTHYTLRLLNQGKFSLTPSERPIAECALTRICRAITEVVQDVLDTGDGRGLWPKDIEDVCRIAGALYNPASRGSSL